MIIKYEISPNFCIKNFQQFSTFKLNSNILTTFSFKNYQQTKIEVTNVQIIASNHSYIEQIKNNYWIISGGSSQISQRFALLEQSQNNFKVKENQSIFKRTYHRTVYDSKNLVFLIGGEASRSNEIYNMKRDKFTQDLNDFPITLRTFGLCFNKNILQIFGGYNFDKNEAVNSIYTCDLINQEWKKQETEIIEKSSTSAAYSQKQNSCFIWNSGGNLSRTLVYDFASIKVHGQAMDESTYTYSKPISQENFIFFYRRILDLHVYDIKTGTWNRIEEWKSFNFKKLDQK